MSTDNARSTNIARSVVIWDGQILRNRKILQNQQIEEINLFHVNSEVWRVQEEPVLDEKISRAQQICGVSFTFFRLHVCIIMALLQYVKEKLGLATWHYNTMNVEKVGSVLAPLKITNPRNAPPDDILHIYKHIFVTHWTSATDCKRCPTGGKQSQKFPC